MPDNAISRLLKVLALEKKQGYRNKAVIGGLDKFVSRWESSARAETANPAAVSEIVALLLGYPALEDTAVRARILDQVIRRASEIGTVEPPRVEHAVPAQEASAAPPPAAEEAKPEWLRERPGETLVPARSKPFPAGPIETRPSVPTPVAPAPLSPAPEAMAAATAAQPPAAPVSSLPADQPGTEHLTQEARPRPREAPQPPRPPSPGLGLDAPITRLPAIGPSYAQKLAKLGVRTVHDLLYLLPHRYEDYSQLRTIDRLKWGEEVTVIGTVWGIKSRIIGEDRRMVTAVVGDGTGEMEMTWFNPFVERRLHTGHAFAFSGKVDSYRNVPVIRNPEFEPLDKNQISTGRMVPVYPLTEGITVHWLRGVIKRTIEAWAADLPDFLPEEVRRETGLVSLADALAQIHFPDGREQLAAAHRRLSFDEFFVLQLGVLGFRRCGKSIPGPGFPKENGTCRQPAVVACLVEPG